VLEASRPFVYVENEREDEPYVIQKIELSAGEPKYYQSNPEMKGVDKKSSARPFVKRLGAKSSSLKSLEPNSSFLKSLMLNSTFLKRSFQKAWRQI
jgi:hypothetical protein